MATRNKDLQAILQAFAAIPKEARKSIKPALDKGGDELVARMKYLAPEKTGKLKQSIRKEDLPGGLGVRVTAGDESTMVEARKGSGVMIQNALLQEYGSAENPQSPYFWPSVNTLKKRVRRRVDRAISKAVKEAWKK